MKLNPITLPRINHASNQHLNSSPTRRAITLQLDHTQLPDSDDNFVKNFQEHPQSVILTTAIEPLLDKIHPDKDYCIGQNSGIYWRFTELVEKGVEAPDWFYVAGVLSRLEGKLRRSYVMWKEKVPPLIVIEFVSGDGEKELAKALAIQEREKKEKLAAYLRSLGINPNEI
jgi:Uma2 family endonuclease